MYNTFVVKAALERERGRNSRTFELSWIFNFYRIIQTMNYLERMKNSHMFRKVMLALIILNAITVSSANCVGGTQCDRST